MRYNVCYKGTLLCALLGVVAVFAAPVKEEALKESTGTQISDVAMEDHDLEDLLALVHKQSRQDGVMVHKAHMTHIENNNGKSVKVEQKEEKVLDSNTGSVISDVKQQVRTTGNTGNVNGAANGEEGAAPVSVVETEIDVPSQGVHETFVQDAAAADVNHETPEQPAADAAGEITETEDEQEGAEQPEEEEEEEEEGDLTPADIASYLYNTQQFDAFYAAMNKLVNESKMTKEDAEAYTKEVAKEFERIELEDLESRFTLERRSFPQDIQDNRGYGSAPGYGVYGRQPMGAADSFIPPFDMLSYVNTLMTPEEREYIAERQALSDLLAAESADPYQFVAALWNEAYGNGNEEAQEIVRLLYDRVSHDSNPDDMGEIRDILLDTFATSVVDTPYSYGADEDTPIDLPNMSTKQSLNVQEAQPVETEGEVSESKNLQLPKDSGKDETADINGDGESDNDGENENVEQELNAVANKEQGETEDDNENEEEEESIKNTVAQLSHM